eukprot:TRINITY_DN1511_c0_g1_i1.p1 TRINITY_DN1511_c0_g1~~TRINITY_DN1511_c0_g1_i1.p1  ORF type:complete len:461 (-),score=171.16 TRINITY_DN1511_c0_g1_i1:364-1746(-)
MEVIIGTDNGMVKVVRIQSMKQAEYNQSRFNVKQATKFVQDGFRKKPEDENAPGIEILSYGNPKMENEIEAMHWGRNLTEFIVGDKKGVIKLVSIPTTINLQQFNTVATYTVPQPQKKEYGKFVTIRKFSNSDPNTFICVTEQGHTFFLDSSLTLHDKQPTHQLQKNISVAKLIQGNSFLAYGGEENEFKLYDFATSKPKFTARNVKHDTVDLRQPVHVTDLTAISDNEFVTVTKYRQIRLYDIRAQRRPVLSVVYGNNPFTRVEHKGPGSKNIYVTDTMGKIFEFEMRKPNTKEVRHTWAEKEAERFAVGAFGGYSGAVRSLQLVKSKTEEGEDKGWLVGGGLDRFINVHDYKTRKVVIKVYVKQRINFLFAEKILDNVKKEKMEQDVKEEEEEEEEAEEEDQEDWEELEEEEQDSDESEEEEKPQKGGKRKRVEVKGGRGGGAGKGQQQNKKEKIKDG